MRCSSPIAVLIILFPLAASAKPAKPACDGARQGIAEADCLAHALHDAEQTRDQAFERLDAKLPAPRQAALRADEQAWTETRDRVCDQAPTAQSGAPLFCRIQATEQHAKFLIRQYRACVSTRCSDLTFYNTQDDSQGGPPQDTGPSLTRYPAISRYHGADAGYIAVYAHDGAHALYAVGGDVSVVGFVRLRGRYEGGIFQPAGYDGQDISADSAFKRLTAKLFPGHPRGTWAGGDTSGFVEGL